MSSELLWKAFDLQFQLFDRIVSFPFTWDAKSRQLSSVPKTFLGFYFSRLQVLYFSLVQLCNWLHTFRHFMFPNPFDSFLYTLMLCTQALPSFAVVTFSIYYCLHTEDICAMFNNATKTFLRRKIFAFKISTEIIRKKMILKIFNFRSPHNKRNS